MKKNILYALVLLFSITACNQKESNTVVDSHEGHDHGEVKLKLTEYSAQFELYAEADPFVKGVSSEILAHFTNLSDFTPVSDASIQASIVIGDNEYSQTIDNPTTPGIYKFSIKPEVNGSGKLIFNIKTEKGSEQIDSKVVVYGDDHTAIHIAEKKEIVQVGAIAFTKEQSWKVDFKTVFPSVEKFGKVIKTTAQILPSQNSETLVTAKTNGVVKFHKNVLEGQNLIPGATLLSISGKGLANDNAEVRFLEAKNNYEAAKANYDRKFALVQKQIVSEKDVEEAKAEFENSKAVFDNLKNNFNANGQLVSSPIKGVVKRVSVANGQYVQAGDVLFSLVSDYKLIVKAEVQQKNFPLLSSISSFNFKSATNNTSYKMEDLNGMLLTYGKNIDEDEGYLIPVNFQIDKDKDILAGSFVDIYIKTTTNNNAVVVPNTALIEEQGTFYVFVQLTPELFEKREIKIGLSDGINTEVLYGIDKSERIVSRGAIIVKLAAVSNSLDPHAGHVH
jgi:membrane fusion protein, heavy metal efflux system